MIHVDVRRPPEVRGYTIEVSVDGARFVEHWFLPARGANRVESDLAATYDARMYAAGIKFGGAAVRLTAFGEDVYVPAMDTITGHTPRRLNT